MVAMVTYMLTPGELLLKLRLCIKLYKDICLDLMAPGKQKLQPFKLPDWFLTSRNHKINMGVNGNGNVLRISAAIKLVRF